MIYSRIVRWTAKAARRPIQKTFVTKGKWNVVEESHGREILSKRAYKKG
jgi:hypothetical protein